MQKMKNGKKVLSVCLSLAMAAGMLSTSAFASWNVYGGSNNHNAVVTEAPTRPDKSGLDSYIQLHCTGSGWDGVDNVPVLQTVNGTTYDGTTGSQVWGTTGDTYALGGMAIDNGYAVFGNDYNHLYVVHD